MMRGYPKDEQRFPQGFSLRGFTVDSELDRGYGGFYVVVGGFV